jgi:hypothetical protein
MENPLFINNYIHNYNSIFSEEEIDLPDLPGLHDSTTAYPRKTAFNNKLILRDC